MDLSGPSATTSTSPATTPPATLATVPLATIPATADETSKQSDPGQAILGPESTNLINSSSTSSLHVLPTDTAIPSGSAQLNGTTPLVLATQDGDKTSDETNGTSYIYFCVPSCTPTHFCLHYTHSVTPSSHQHNDLVNWFSERRSRRSTRFPGPRRR